MDSIKAFLQSKLGLALTGAVLAILVVYNQTFADLLRNFLALFGN